MVQQTQIKTVTKLIRNISAKDRVKLESVRTTVFEYLLTYWITVLYSCSLLENLMLKLHESMGYSILSMESLSHFGAEEQHQFPAEE